MKLQTTIHNTQLNYKSQHPNILVIGAWSLFDSCYLVLGISIVHNNCYVR